MLLRPFFFEAESIKKILPPDDGVVELDNVFAGDECVRFRLIFDKKAL